MRSSGRGKASSGPMSTKGGGDMRRALIRIVTAAGLAALPGVAAAQKPEREVETSRGPSSELYIRKRPPAPEAPILSAELKTLLASTEKRRDDKRLEAI